MTTEHLVIKEPELNNQAELGFAMQTPKQLAWQDVKEGFLQFRIWLMLASQDLKLRYRRSILGPFWITLSMAITVYTMGFLYSHLFRMPLAEYFPYLVGGMLSWSLLSTTTTDMVETFSLNANLLKQIKLPYTLYIHRVAARNIMIFFHNLLVIIPIMIIYHEQIPLHISQVVMLMMGLCIIYVNALFYGIVFAMLGSRYYDISQLIKSLIQIVFFMTPVMWKPSILPADKQFFVELNPIYSLIECIRAPLLGYSLSLNNIIMVTLFTIVGMLLAYVLFVPRRARIIYWL